MANTRYFFENHRSSAWRSAFTVSNGSLALDLKIVALTLVHGLGGRGRIRAASC